MRCALCGGNIQPNEKYYKITEKFPDAGSSTVDILLDLFSESYICEKCLRK